MNKDVFLPEEGRQRRSGLLCQKIYKGRRARGCGTGREGDCFEKKKSCRAMPETKRIFPSRNKQGSSPKMRSDVGNCNPLEEEMEGLCCPGGEKKEEMEVGLENAKRTHHCQSL